MTRVFLLAADTRAKGSSGVGRPCAKSGRQGRGRLAPGIACAPGALVSRGAGRQMVENGLRHKVGGQVNTGQGPASSFDRLLPDCASSTCSVSCDFFSPSLCSSDSPFPCCLTCFHIQYSSSTTRGWSNAICHLVCPWLVKYSRMGTS